LSAEEFLTGEFENNLGSHCKLVAKDGKITGEYFNKPSRGKLVQPGFPVNGIYTSVKDGALLTMNITFKKKFKMNWLLMNNENENNEWFVTSFGQDYFKKIK